MNAFNKVPSVTLLPAIQQLTPDCKHPKDSRKVLLIQGNHSTGTAVYNQLLQAGFKVRQVPAGEKAIRLAVSLKPDVLLVDDFIPGAMSAEFCTQVREVYRKRILVLPSRDSDNVRLEYLRCGADDLIRAPFSIEDFFAKLHPQDEMETPTSSTTRAKIIGENIVIDPLSYEVRVKGELKPFSRVEFQILYAMASKPGHLFTNNALARIAQETTGFTDQDYLSRPVNVHLFNLRKKIETDPTSPRHICTIHGAGYKFQF